MNSSQTQTLSSTAAAGDTSFSGGSTTAEKSALSGQDPASDFTSENGCAKQYQGAYAAATRQDKSRAVWVKSGQAYRKRKDTGLPILMYHYFYDPSKGEHPAKVNADNYMDIDKFEAEVAWLCREHFYFPTWPEVEGYFEGRCELPKHSVVLTSDDGQKSFFSEAVPVVERYAAQGARITGNVIGDKFKKKYLRAYDPNVVSFQSHTYAMHVPGANGARGRMLTSSSAQIEADARRMDGLLGHYVACCYPYGSVTPKIEQALKAAGVKLGLAIINRRAHANDDPLAIPRVRMEASQTLATFKAVVS
ncbi:MAG: polysaccharide deacetylase family protein [Coriobacteriales bacterium]|nr:polysaccharide deacetylase family protein [Coriobacteriales bacterium]